jgi:PadR family transcriptional regulator
MNMAQRRRLSFSSFSVLYALANGHRYGFDIMEATGLASGTVYPVLSRLKRDGLVDSSWEDESLAAEEGRPARRYYGLTHVGMEALHGAVSMLKGIAGERLVLPRHSPAK